MDDQPIGEQSEEISFSESVKKARDSFPADEEVSAIELVLAVLEGHGEYGRGKASSISLDTSGKDAIRRTTQAWLDDLQTLYNPEKTVEIHGRLAIIGLATLDPPTRGQLKHDDFLDTVEREVSEPLDDLLSERGKALRHPVESVPNQPDNPLLLLQQDQLGRAAFAQYLARRISAVPADNSGAYAIHLYGPWGSGKSTLLNFLEKALETQPSGDPAGSTNKTGWHVVTFNAWRNQRAGPPWWALMDSVYRQSKKELDWQDTMQERRWRARLSSKRLAFLLGITLVVWILALYILPLMLASGTASLPTLNSLAVVADDLGKIIALLVTVWAGIQAANKPLMLGSATAAQSYIEYADDPMNEIKQRFTKLIERIPKRVAIFVDDLDRCQSDYVVELLEGIQTLFREAPVVYVVAADRRWLNACYEEVYSQLRPLVYEPGKPLGTLFLEKAFQFSTSVPGIPDELKNAFWKYLIQVEAAGELVESAAARETAESLLAGAESEGDIMEVIAGSGEKPFLEQRALREEAVRRLASPEFTKRTEHVLKPFAPLLEPNPRAMIRLVNAYSVNRALATLVEVDIERGNLVQWTILMMRWPLLADHLEQHPQDVAKIGPPASDETGESEQHPQEVAETGTPDNDDDDKRVRDLFSEPQVVRVVHSDQVERPLDEQIVRLCALLRS